MSAAWSFVDAITLEHVIYYSYILHLQARRFAFRVASIVSFVQYKMCFVCCVNVYLLHAVDQKQKTTRVK